MGEKEDRLTGHQALGRAIRLLREERGVRRGDLAERAGISYTHLAEIENGRKSPSSGSLASLAEALGVRPYEVMAVADGLASGETSITRAALERPQLQAFPASDAVVAASPAARDLTPSPSRKSRRSVIDELLEVARRLPAEDQKRLLDLARRLYGSR